MFLSKYWQQKKRLKSQNCQEFYFFWYDVSSSSKWYVVALREKTDDLSWRFLVANSFVALTERYLIFFLLLIRLTTLTNRTK